jgi:hypothetical protein
MYSPIPAKVLVLSSSQASWGEKLSKRLTPRGLQVDSWDEVRLGTGRAVSRELDQALGGVSVLVVFSCRRLAASGALKRVKLRPPAGENAPHVIIAAVDDSALRGTRLSGADVFAPHGVLEKMKPAGQEEALDLLAQEVLAEIEPSYAPQPVNHFEEYKLLFENAERLFDRRQNAAQIYLGINTAVSAAFTFAAKDLGLTPGRLLLITVPLFLAGALACSVWLRAIRQYETMLEWRFRQLRRMERRGFAESYRIFTKEWEAIYRPRRRGPFGFTRLESFAPRAFLGIYLVAFVLVIIQWVAGAGGGMNGADSPRWNGCGYSGLAFTDLMRIALPRR